MKNRKIINSFIALFAITFSFFSLNSCASKPVVYTTSPVYVTNSKIVYILTPENMDGKVDSMQLLLGDFGETSYSLLVYFYSDEKGIQLDLMNELGTDMGSIIYDGSNVNFHSSIFPSGMKAEYIILDIQNAYYKFDALKEVYESSGLEIEEEITENGKIRKIMNGKNVIEQITILENSITIQNNLRGYSYNLIIGEE